MANKVDSKEREVQLMKTLIEEKNYYEAKYHSL